MFDPNLGRLRQRVEELAGHLRTRLAAGAAATPEELADYRGAVLYLLFLRYEDDWLALSTAGENGRGGSKSVGCYERFAADVAHFSRAAGPDTRDGASVRLGLSGRRAFHHIFRKVFGCVSSLRLSAHW